MQENPYLTIQEAQTMIAEQPYQAQLLKSVSYPSIDVIKHIDYPSPMSVERTDSIGEQSVHEINALKVEQNHYDR